MLRKEYKENEVCPMRKFFSGSLLVVLYDFFMSKRGEKESEIIFCC